MSQYLEALRQAMVIYPIIVVLFTVPYIAWIATLIDKVQTAELGQLKKQR